MHISSLLSSHFGGLMRAERQGGETPQILQIKNKVVVCDLLTC